MMDAKLKELRNELSSILKINFRGIETGYELIEYTIIKADKIQTFSKEQWEAIIASKYNYLFQHGVPHVSWHTDRSDIFNVIVRTCKCISNKMVNRTWHKETTAIYETAAGVRLCLIKEEPNYYYDASGFHPTHYTIKVI